MSGKHSVKRCLFLSKFSKSYLWCFPPSPHAMVKNAYQDSPLPLWVSLARSMAVQRRDFVPLWQKDIILLPPPCPLSVQQVRALKVPCYFYGSLSFSDVKQLLSRISNWSTQSKLALNPQDLVRLFFNHLAAKMYVLQETWRYDERLQH